MKKLSILLVAAAMSASPTFAQEAEVVKCRPAKAPEEQNVLLKTAAVPFKMLYALTLMPGCVAVRALKD